MFMTSNSLPDRVDLVVLGGGPAGLAAAWEASLAGKTVLVVERQTQLGGLCATVERDGFRFDLGGHRIVSKRATLVARVRELLGDQLEEQTRKSVIWLDGQRFAYPLVARELVEKLPARLLARASADYAQQALTTVTRRLTGRDAPDISFEQWVTRRFGRTLYELFFGPYTEKLWGVHPSELSADWAAQRISLLNLADVAARLTGVRHGGARTYARRYLYPRGGIGVLFERLATVLSARGVRFVTEATVSELCKNEPSGAVTAVRLAVRGAETLVRCEGVVSSIPLEQLASLLEPGRVELRRAAAGLAHRGLRFLNVMLSRPGPLLGATWMYVSDPSLVMTRVQEPAERSRSMCPSGSGSLMVEIPCDMGSAMSGVADDKLLERVLPELNTLGMKLQKTDVLGVFSSYATHAYPMYTLDYAAHRDTLLAAVDRCRNVWTVGRQGLFRYVFMDTAMEMGFAAVREFCAGQKTSTQSILAIDSNPTLHEVQSVIG
jgi:protoporphyrinogen oxidase